jgi:multidrug resistance protein, MATE family
MNLPFLSKFYLYAYRKTILLAYPVVLSQLGHIMVGVVDTAMVGQLGSNEQASVALANSFYTIVLVFGLGISYGATPMVAAQHPQKDKLEIASLLKHSMLLNTIIGILLFLLLSVLSPFFNLLNQPQIVVDSAIPFFNIMILGMIPLCFFSGLKQFAEGLSYTKTAMLITIGSNIVNIVLNYCMIFGKFGFAPMGLMGSCWASFISRIFMALSMFVYVFYSKSFKSYSTLFSSVKLNFELSKKILKIGIPSGLQWLFEIGAFSIALVMIGWIGAKYQAAHQVALSIAAVTYMMASGISSAATVRVGNQYGRAMKHRLRQAGFSAFILVMAFMFCCACLLILFHNQLPYLFSNDPEVIQIASQLIVIAAFFQLSDGIQVVGLGALRGVNDTKIPTYITLFAYWIIALPLCYFLAFKMNMGVNGIWYGLLVGLSIAAVLLFWRFNNISQKLWRNDAVKNNL